MGDGEFFESGDMFCFLRAAEEISGLEIFSGSLKQEAFTRFQPIVFSVLAAGLGYSQTPAPSQGDALQEFANRPAARAVWMQEVGRVDADGTHAVISAIEMDDATGQPRAVRGIRIDLTDASGEERVYIGVQNLPPNINALEEIAAEAPRYLARSPAGNHMRCFGSGYFWMRPTGDFSASECQMSSGRFLAVRGNRDFRFNGVEPASFASLLIRASEELARR
jgi:hypothetical protein